jgi:hypothetical protein
MKKAPRCPVCGSLQIKPTPVSNPNGGKPEAEKLEKESGKESHWKCYDCYRNFEKPDETG